MEVIKGAAADWSRSNVASDWLHKISSGGRTCLGDRLPFIPLGDWDTDNNRLHAKQRDSCKIYTTVRPITPLTSDTQSCSRKKTTGGNRQSKLTLTLQWLELTAPWVGEKCTNTEQSEYAGVVMQRMHWHTYAIRPGRLLRINIIIKMTISSSVEMACSDVCCEWCTH